MFKIGKPQNIIFPKLSIWLVGIPLNIYLFLSLVSFYVQIPAEKLRYTVGTVLGEGGKDEATKEVEKKLVDQGFKITKFPEVDKMVMSTFPFVNMLSCMIATHRVYPVLGDYIVVRFQDLWLDPVWYDLNLAVTVLQNSR